MAVQEYHIYQRDIVANSQKQCRNARTGSAGISGLAAQEYQARNIRPGSAEISSCSAGISEQQCSVGISEQQCSVGTLERRSIVQEYWPSQFRNIVAAMALQGPYSTGSGEIHVDAALRGYPL